MDAIRAGLVLRPGLSHAQVFSGPVGLEEAGLACIAFGEGRLSEDPFTMGGNRAEVWTIDGEARAFEVRKATTEQTISAARSASLLLFAELESYVNDSYTGEYPDVQVTAGEMRQSFTVDGRSCSLAFTLTITAEKNP